MERRTRPPALPELADALADRVGNLPPTALAALTLVACLGLAALARLIGSSAWLWATLAGGAFLVAYGRSGTRALMLVGAALTGSGVGILFEAVIGWDGAYLMSLGAALGMADALDPPPSHLPLIAGGFLALLGLGLALATADVLSATLLAALVAAGLALVARPQR